MERDPNQPVTLTSCRFEWEAAALLSALRERGVPAFTAGGITSGFRAEAPGGVQILVRRADLERAELVLRQVRAESVDIDWDSVETGDDGRPLRYSGDGSGGLSRRGLWTIILVVMLPAGVLLTLAVGRGGDPVQRALGPIVILAALVMAGWLLTNSPPTGTHLDDDA